MPRHPVKIRPIFVFLGVTESGTNANISELQQRLEKLPAEYNHTIKIEPKGDLFILTLSNPDFYFYVSIVKNDSGELPYWTDLAKNFNLPWDKKPVSATKLLRIYESLDKGGKSEYNTYHDIGFRNFERIGKIQTTNTLVRKMRFIEQDIFLMTSVEPISLRNIVRLLQKQILNKCWRIQKNANYLFIPSQKL